MDDNEQGTEPAAVEAFPTDAKEREKDRRKKQKEAGREHKVVKKKKKIVEDHYDDSGDDLTSLKDEDMVGLAYPDDRLEAQQLADDEHEMYHRHYMLYGDPIPCYAGGLTDGSPTSSTNGPPHEAVPAVRAPLTSGRK